MRSSRSFYLVIAMSEFGSAMVVCLVVVCWLQFLNYFPLLLSKISWLFSFLTPIFSFLFHLPGCLYLFSFIYMLEVNKYLLRSYLNTMAFHAVYPSFLLPSEKWKDFVDISQLSSTVGRSKRLYIVQEDYCHLHVKLPQKGNEICYSCVIF